MNSASSGDARARYSLWGWVAAAILAVLLAVAVTQKRTFFFRNTKKICDLTGLGKYTGIVEDRVCRYETMDSLNEEVLHPILQELIATPFFRVCECPDLEFPEQFRKPSSMLLVDDVICQEGKPEATVDHTLNSKAFRGWVEIDNPWTHDDETDSAKMTYVNLQLNPERYIGYVGPAARKMWEAIYTENCPMYPSGETCPEKRVLYKLISGLHASISIHISSDYLIDEATNLWGHNLELLYERVLRYPDHVKNLYFTFFCLFSGQLQRLQTI